MILLCSDLVSLRSFSLGLLSWLGLLSLFSFNYEFLFSSINLINSINFFTSAKMKDELENITVDLITENFELQENENLKLEQIRLFLIDKLRELIYHNSEKLFQILYRIDVKEEKSIEALSKKNAAESLADLIIERQMQKAKTRMEYNRKIKEINLLYKIYSLQLFRH